MCGFLQILTGDHRLLEAQHSEQRTQVVHEKGDEPQSVIVCRRIVNGTDEQKG